MWSLKLRAQTALATASILLLACASTTSSQAWTERIVAAAPTNPPLLIEPGKRLGSLELGMTREQVRAIAGRPDRATGSAWEYLLRGYAVMFDQQDRANAFFAGAWCEPKSALLSAFKGRTAEGIGMGSTRAEVVAALGLPDVVLVHGQENEVLRYSRGLELLLVAGQVTHITVREPAA